MRVLVLNAGSSSLKGALVEPPDRTVARAEVAWGADATRDSGPRRRRADLVARLRDEAGTMARRSTRWGTAWSTAGSRFTAPAVIDDAVLEGIRAVRDLAPLHNGVALDAIEAARAALPDVPHVACFDTAFHATLPDGGVALSPAPSAGTTDWGVRRYGFHGLSVAWSDRPGGRAAGPAGRGAGRSWSPTSARAAR